MTDEAMASLREAIRECLKLRDQKYNEARALENEIVRMRNTLGTEIRRRHDTNPRSTKTP